MTTYLLKSEPTDYSYDDLARDGKTVWDGVTNNAALIHIRSAREGDEALIYHTGKEKSIAGLARIVSDAYPDPRRPERNAKGEAKFAVFDIEPIRRAGTPVTLAAIKGDDRFEGFDLVRQPRLSVMPVPAELDRLLRRLAGL